MSRFFQSFEEEKSESKKKSVEISEKSQEKLTKKESKLKELNSKIEEVLNSGKNFDKLFKRLMNDIKKYTPHFENNEIPAFVLEFFNTPRITSSKQMNSQVQEFIDEFSGPQETVSMTAKEEKRKENTLEIILTIEDDQEKEKELVDYLNRNGNVSNEISSEIYVVLFSIYSRSRNPDKMINTLKNISGLFECDNTFTRIVKKNLDVYLGKIYDLVDKHLFGRYFELLDCLRPFNRDAIEKRFLEMQFFKLNIAEENRNPVFSLLFMVRNDDWSNALKYFRSNEAVFDKSKTSILILYEFARLAARRKGFHLAFEIFNRCSETSLVNTRIEIYSLCVILNEQLTGNAQFQAFLNIFKKFDSNYLVLPSKDPVVEICRAFYLLNMYDYVNASTIIERVSGLCNKALWQMKPSIEQGDSMG